MSTRIKKIQKQGESHYRIFYTLDSLLSSVNLLQVDDLRRDVALTAEVATHILLEKQSFLEMSLLD